MSDGLRRRVLVCGDRNFRDKDWLFAEMDKLRAEIGDFAVVTGGQRQWNRGRREWEGADHYAEEWARARNLWYLGLTPDWSLPHYSGGPIRNRRMLAEAKPLGVVAFPGGKGTADMIRAAGEAGVKVREIVRDVAA